MKNIYKLLDTLKETDEVLMGVLNQVDSFDENVKGILDKWLEVRRSIYLKVNIELEKLGQKPILNDEIDKKIENYFNNSPFLIPEYEDEVNNDELDNKDNFPLLNTLNNVVPTELNFSKIDSEQSIISLENLKELEKQIKDNMIEEPRMTPKKIIGDSKLITSGIISEAVNAINKLQESLFEEEKSKGTRAA